MRVQCWGSELLADGMLVGRIACSRGFAQLSLPNTNSKTSAAVTWAIDFAKEHKQHGVLVSSPGPAEWLTEMGWEHTSAWCSWDTTEPQELRTEY